MVQASERITQFGSNLAMVAMPSLDKYPRREDPRRFLTAQVGELALQFDERMVGAGNVAAAARASTRLGGRRPENAM